MSQYVYAGAADWGGKDPNKCNRGLYRLDTDTGQWTTLDVGLPENVEARTGLGHKRWGQWWFTSEKELEKFRKNEPPARMEPLGYV